MRISDWSSDVCSSDLAVAQIIAAWTGIPVGKMVSDEIQTVLGLRDLLEERVIGQGHALDAIAQRVRTSRANLEDPGKPKGVFLDRKSVVSGKSVSVRVDLGGRRIIQTRSQTSQTTEQ